MTISLDEILDSHRTGRAIIAGILNITPDSFSDGGEFLDPAQALRHARQMIADGAEIIDVGAESTRPGSRRVQPAEQIARLKNVLPALRDCGAVVSIDTTRAEVARFAIESGAKIINDISAGREDAGMFALAGQAGCAMVLMHMLGTPADMQTNPQYKDVVGEVRQFLQSRLDAAIAAGLPPERIILDPGIGFGKKLEHNLALLVAMDKFVQMGQPVMIGVSRKKFISQLVAQDTPSNRTWGTVAACLACRSRGASIFRVHDVAELSAALAVAKAIG
jgi:dihydropteroate synthase